jgi:predicted metalloprotease with PDZ domain
MALIFVLSTGTAPAATQENAEEPNVEYQLRPVPEDNAAIDVALSFSLRKGGKALLQAEWESSNELGGEAEPQVEFAPPTDPGYTIEPFIPPGLDSNAARDSGSIAFAPRKTWVVKASEDARYTLKYRVVLQGLDQPRGGSETAQVFQSPRAVTDSDLTVFKASDVLICPRKDLDGKTFSKTYRVGFDVENDDKVLVPWAADGKSKTSYIAGSESELLENFITWGRLELVNDRVKDTEVTVGFSADYEDQEQSERKLYVESLAGMLDDYRRTLGERPGLERLTVTACGAHRFGLEAPAAAALLDSVLLFHGGKSLNGAAAIAASAGLFNLWNGRSLVAKPGGEAEWFQSGLELFYPQRVAAVAGLVDSKDAYRDFSRVYESYLSDPRAGETPLASADADSDSFFATKGAAVTAAMSKRLQEESSPAKDIDWLLGELAEKFDHFKGGDYTLVDMAELLEDATDTSWDRFFERYVRGTGPVLASQFSATDLFGSNTTFGRVLNTGSGSGRNWIYLLVAVVLILMIPLIFSAYVRRAVKLDLSMPKILPDDEDEEE